MEHALDSLEQAPPSDRWYVTNGVVAVGPVTFELLLRGVAHGRIPSSSFVRHETWQVWRRLEDIESLSAGNRRQTIEDLGTISAGVATRARSIFSEPPPPPSGRELSSRTDNTLPSTRNSFRPVAVDPVGVLSTANALSDALLFAVATAVTAAAADIGLVHHVRSDLGGPVTVGGHGPQTELLLGEKLGEDDPTLTAARGGHTIISEFQPGEAARYVFGRVTRCLPEAQGVAMVPLVLYGELIALFEVGRRFRPFRAREIARMEDVIEALAERIVVMGWLE